MVDTFNRQLVDILGMQYCFRTACFETRWAQHFLMPVTYINAINAAKYFEPAAYRESGTKSMLIVLASSMVHNPEWMEILNTPRAGPGGGGQCRSGRSFNVREPTWSQVRIDGGPPSRESPAKHVLILLHQLEGYKGAKQQRCWECNELVSWCCVRCSNANSWVPLHPPGAGIESTVQLHCCSPQQPCGWLQSFPPSSHWRFFYRQAPPPHPHGSPVSACCR